MAYPVRRLKMRSKRALSSAARSGLGVELERFELTIEPPDHPPGDFDGVALPVVGGNELVDEALGVNPAQRVVADAELSGVVGEDDGAGEPILGAERAPQRAFAGHAHGIGGDPQLGQAERARDAPVHSASQANSRTSALAERIDDAVRQIGRAHIGRRRRVDRVARRPAQEIAQEREARFARSGAERREPVGAELRRVAGLAGVARAGVVDADEAARREGRR